MVGNTIFYFLLFSHREGNYRMMHAFSLEGLFAYCNVQSSEKKWLYRSFDDYDIYRISHFVNIAAEFT